MVKYITLKSKYCLLLMVFLIFFVINPVLAESNSPVIKMITLNLHDGRDEQKIDNLERTINFFKKVQADFICLQEVEPKHLKIFKKAGYQVVLGMNANRFPFRFGNAVLTRHRVIYKRHFYLPSNLEQRGINLALLEINGREFAVINTHLGLGKEERQRQFAEIIRIIGFLNEPIIVVGDFNVRSATDDLFKNFREQFKEIGDSYLLPGTFPSSNPKHRIDLIWYSQHWQLVQAEVILWYGSDHLPVAAEFELNQPESISFKAPKITPFDRVGNPLLPDIGELTTKIEITLTEPDIFTGLLTVPIADKLSVSGAYWEEKPVLGLNYLLTTIDLRDYGSLRRWRGKGEWIISAFSDLKEDTWLEWEQYYRWSNHWGSKIIGSFKQDQVWIFEQIYLPAKKFTWSVGLDNKQNLWLRFTFTPDLKETFGVQYLENNDFSQWSLKWEYRY